MEEAVCSAGSPWPSGPGLPLRRPLGACCRDTGTLAVIMLRILVICPDTRRLLFEPTASESLNLWSCPLSSETCFCSLPQNHSSVILAFVSPSDTQNLFLWV